MPLTDVLDNLVSLVKLAFTSGALELWLLVAVVVEVPPHGCLVGETLVANFPVLQSFPIVAALEWPWLAA